MNPNAKTFTPTKQSTATPSVAFSTFTPQTDIIYPSQQPPQYPPQPFQHPPQYQNSQYLGPPNLQYYPTNFPLTNALSTLSISPTPSQPIDAQEAPPTPLGLLSTIFPNLESDVLQEALRTHGNDLASAVLVLSEQSDLDSKGILDGIYNDQLDGGEDEGEEEDFWGNEKEPEAKQEKKEEKQPQTAPKSQVEGNKPQVTQNQPSKPSNGTTPKPASSKPKNKPAAKSNAPKEEQQVCKYFLLGQCYRKDCMFLHTDKVVCRYWKLGTCSRGDTCIYMHAEDTPKPPEPKIAPTKPAKPQISEAPPKIEETKEHAAPMPRKTPLNVDMAAKIKLKQLQTLFHHIEEKVVRDTFFANNFDTAATTDSLTRLYGKPRKVETVATTATTKEVHAPRAPKKWVTTGDEVANLYTQYRQEAIEHATIRNTCFQFATTAYLSGDGLAAKEWSKRGRYHDEMMQKLHREACMRILETRNKDLYADMMLDLHGLHKREAIDVLSQKIDFIKKSNATKSSERIHAIYVLVGTGHHATFGKSTLARAVQNYLDENRIRYTDCSDDNRGGMLTVYIK